MHADRDLRKASGCHKQAFLGAFFYCKRKTNNVAKGYPTSSCGDNLNGRKRTTNRPQTGDQVRPSAEEDGKDSDRVENRQEEKVIFGRETKGRRGKGVTIISDLPLNEHDLTELAAKLKQRLGTGGTVKDGRIDIQGDHRDRIVVELEGMGYRVKRVGG